jgi:hypothetical protein
VIGGLAPSNFWDRENCSFKMLGSALGEQQTTTFAPPVLFVLWLQGFLRLRLYLCYCAQDPANETKQKSSVNRTAALQVNKDTRSPACFKAVSSQSPNNIDLIYHDGF